MIDKILEISLRQRAFVLLAAFALLGVGLWSGSRLPIDAVPDITGVQVQINTEVPALAAEESERLVTRPIEIEMAGLPGVTAAQASASIFPRFNAGSGFRDVRGGVNIIYRLSPRWFVAGDASVTRLMGDAARSPISISDTNVMVTTMIGYRF